MIYNAGEVVGCHFLEEAQRQVAQTCMPNTPVTVQRDAANQYDPNAVKVFVEGVEIGFIPKDVAPAIALFIDGGYTVEGAVNGRIGKGSRGNQKMNPAVTLWATQ